jgi:hypothetical protein
MSNVPKCKKNKGMYLSRCWQRLRTLDWHIFMIKLSSHNILRSLDPILLPTGIFKILQFVTRVENWEFVSNLLKLITMKGGIPIAI